MATRTEIVLTCDVCETEDLVGTHTLSIDGKTVDAEACDPCWNRILTALIPIAKAGRTPQLKKVTGKKEIMPFPGVSWKFTAHALKRMGERYITPETAAKAADDPQVISAGRDDKSEVRRRGGIQVVVRTDLNTIVTVAKRDEEIDEVT